jgi:hypothetical protein
VSAPITIGAAVAAATLPALAATGHPWIAGGGLLLVLAAVELRIWLELRAKVARDREMLSYAQTSVSLGVDPASVVVAMRPRRRHEQDSHEEDLQIGRWVHLPPSRDDY